MATFNTSEILKSAHKIAKADKFYKLAKYSTLFASALKAAWSQAKNGVKEVSVDVVASFSSAIPMCFGYICNNRVVEVTYRGKRSDKVFVDVQSRTVQVVGKTYQIASQIATQFNFSII